MEYQCSDIEGVGIGLNYSKKIIEMMGGEIGVESEKGVGSTFWFTLIEGEEVNKEELLEEKSNIQDTLKLDHYNIVYIEDNPANTDLMKAMMEKFEKVNLVTFSNPVEGLKKIKDMDLDLILLDVNLPEMSGYEVLKALQTDEKYNNIPIVAITANAMTSDIEKGKKAGFNDYVTKPLTLNKVRKILKNHLG